MLKVEIVDSKRMGCEECGYYPEDLRLAMVQVVYPHAKARICLDCLNTLRGRLNDLALNWKERAHDNQS